MPFPMAGFPMPPGIFMSPAYHAMMGVVPGMPYGYPGAFPYPTMHQHPSPPSQNMVTEQDFVKMIQRHRKRRSQDEVWKLKTQSSQLDQTNYKFKCFPQLSHTTIDWQALVGHWLFYEQLTNKLSSCCFLGPSWTGHQVHYYPGNHIPYKSN